MRKLNATATKNSTKNMNNNTRNPVTARKCTQTKENETIAWFGMPFTPFS